MTVKPITKTQANKALAVIKDLARKRYGYTDAELDSSDLTLNMTWDWPSGGPTPTILWEGGEYEWAYNWSYEVTKKVPGVFAEPYAGYALCLYREDS